MREKILVIDDEKLIRWSLQKDLEKEGYETITVGTVAASLQKFEEFSPEVVLLDIRLEDGDGVELLKLLKKKDPNVIVMMITANDDIRTAVQCMKLGAFTYLHKPFNFEEVRLNIENALESHKLKRKVMEWERIERGKYDFSNVVAESPKMKAVLEIVRQVVRSEATTVLLQGESGSGKDLIARTIHYAGRRAGKGFMEINCAALPGPLLESELFGYEKGAFTDARQAKKGLVEEAGGGTLFLDEIGDMPKELQAKILHLIDQKKFRKVGGVSELTSDIRIVAATNKDLKKEAAEGRFREDLFYRLHVIPIHLPPLRERKEDIQALVGFFVAHFNREFGKTISEIDPEAMSVLMNYQWPGNVRELRNVIERVIILNQGNRIGLEHLPAEIDCSCKLKEVLKLSNQPSSSKNFAECLSGIPLDAIEKQVIIHTLEVSKGNQSHAARMLNIGRDALRYKMQKYGILDKNSKSDLSEIPQAEDLAV